MPSSKDKGPSQDCAPPHAHMPYYISHNYYAVTIKSTGKNNYTSPEDLYHELMLLGSKRQHLDIGHHVYELDSRNRLHLHAMVQCPKFFARQKKGWHIHSTELETFDSIKKWMNYLYKVAYNEPSQGQILALNYLYNHNCFI